MLESLLEHPPPKFPLKIRFQHFFCIVVGVVCVAAAVIRFVSIFRLENGAWCPFVFFNHVGGIMKKLVVVCALVGSPAFAGSTHGVVLGQQAEVLRLGQNTDLNAELIGGGVVTPEEYPGVFYTRQGNSRCTGTVIGSRVVASAAHCMSNGGSLELTHAGKTYRGKCTHAPEYRNNSTADWALCLLSEEIPDAIAESINIDTARLKIGGEIVLMGYGCVQNGGGGGNDGKLRTGRAPISRLPSGTNYDIVTKGKSALCYGDSGGPSFYVDTETGDAFSNRHKQPRRHQHHQLPELTAQSDCAALLQQLERIQ